MDVQSLENVYNASQGGHSDVRGGHRYKHDVRARAETHFWLVIA